MDTTLLVVIVAEFILVTISVLIVIIGLVPDITATSDASDASIEGENALLDSATTDPWINYNYLGYYPEAAMMGFIPWVYIPFHYQSAPAPSPAATAKGSEVATAQPSRVLAESVS